jgi:hypothetical protein
MTKLSPFYQEIIAHLQSKVLERFDESILIGQFSEQLQQLAKMEVGDLDPAIFSTMIERYNAAEEQTQLSRVEGDWMNAFSEREFESLGLKNYFPKIYRGLPRLYHRDNPSRSKIKKNFTSLSRLKISSVERALFSLYDHFEPKAGTRIGILVWVMPDGLGDWMAAQETARVLHERFSELEIHLFAITQRNSLPQASFETHLIQYQGEAERLPFQIDFKMDLVIQIPTYFPNSELIFAHQRMECIGEYGFLDSSWFHPRSMHRSMGLHALEKGIFIRKHQVYAFAEIENRSLLLSLFGTKTPGPIEMDLYDRKTRFHLAYLATPSGGAIYLHSLLKMWERDGQDIDVCSPDIGWLIQWVEIRQRAGLSPLQETFGVKELVIEWEGQNHRAQIAEKGKIVRIISPGVLSFSDMHKLIYLSGDWIGVRGNQSLSEALSAGKAFFYDGREHSRYLIKDLLALAENRLSGHKLAVYAFRLIGQAFLWNLPEDLEEWVDETYFQQQEKMNWFTIAIELGICLQDPDAIAGFKKLGLICSEEQSFAPFICHLVQRNLIHLQNPLLKEKEKEWSEQYGRSEISFTTLIQNLKNECSVNS